MLSAELTEISTWHLTGTRDRLLGLGWVRASGLALVADDTSSLDAGGDRTDLTHGSLIGDPSHGDLPGRHVMSFLH